MIDGFADSHHILQPLHGSGYKDNEEVKFYGRRGNPAGQVWERVMKAAHEGLDPKKFEKPANITYATICKDSGLRATALCAKDPRGNRTYTEVFVKGTVPSKTCDCHQEVKVCDVDGTLKLATEYCQGGWNKVFITRKNYEKNTSWQSAGDAKYMPPTEECKVHTKESIKNTVNNIINNTINSVTSNSVTNSTTNSNITKNNTTTNNTSKNNTTTNTTNKNNTTANNTTTQKPSTNTAVNITNVTTSTNAVTNATTNTSTNNKNNTTTKPESSTTKNNAIENSTTKNTTN